MSIFERLANENIKCELCGCETIASFGCGWDNDRIFCTNRKCQAEYTFPTTTEAKEE